ncbi:4Fe-4S dicluster domain-containing protein [Niabella terrae]
MVPQILFTLLVLAAVYLFYRNAQRIRSNIRMGQAVDVPGPRSMRWRNVLLLAFGQKKMFRNPLVGLLHFLVYAGFIIINIEVLEIVLDGLLGTHRLFAAPLGGFYHFLINAFEVLAVLVIIACAIFLVRRNLLKLKRFISKDLDGWPRNDANYILITEILLMSFFLTMNASDGLLQARNLAPYNEVLTGNFLISGLLQPMFNGLSDPALVGLERSCWWLHIAGILAFLNYLPYSKHLHILLAFPNAYYARLEPMGKMGNMPSIQNEVLYAMQPELTPADAAPTEKFGARDVLDLNWKHLLDAYSCTECGRCSVACPANLTGKKLSPRKIMMNTRDRAEEVGKNIARNKSFQDDGKSLLHDYISVEELRACTTCNACVQECPVSINPLDIIVQLRRQLVMEESNAPQEWNAMFSNIEVNFAPWKLPPDDRDQWAQGLEEAS